jgi:hypothetical protein
MDQKQLQAQVARHRRSIAKHQAEVNKLLSQCQHDVLESKTQHVSGGYFDRAYTRTYQQCSLCGATQDVKTEQHSWYG